MDDTAYKAGPGKSVQLWKTNKQTKNGWVQGISFTKWAWVISDMDFFIYLLRSPCFRICITYLVQDSTKSKAIKA